MQTLEQNIKTIVCPHMERSSHNAVLYADFHKWAGQWECGYGFSGQCQHLNQEVELIEGAYLYGGELHETSYLADVCQSCGVVVDAYMKEDFDGSQEDE